MVWTCCYGWFGVFFMRVESSFFRSLQEAKGILVPRVPTGATTKFVGAAAAVQNGISVHVSETMFTLPLVPSVDTVVPLCS